MKLRTTAEHTITIGEEDARLLFNALHAIQSNMSDQWEIFDQHGKVQELMDTLDQRPRV